MKAKVNDDDLKKTVQTMRKTSDDKDQAIRPPKAKPPASPQHMPVKVMDDDDDDDYVVLPARSSAHASRIKSDYMLHNIIKTIITKDLVRRKERDSSLAGVCRLADTLVGCQHR